MWSNKRFYVWLVVFSLFFLRQEIFAQDNSGNKDVRNPFIPLVTPDGRLLVTGLRSDKEELKLEGIIYDKNGISYALINAEVVGIGDSINGYRLIKIEKDKITLVKEGQVIQIELKEEK